MVTLKLKPALVPEVNVIQRKGDGIHRRKDGRSRAYVTLQRGAKDVIKRSGGSHNANPEEDRVIGNQSRTMILFAPNPSIGDCGPERHRRFRYLVDVQGKSDLIARIGGGLGCAFVYH